MSWEAWGDDDAGEYDHLLEAGWWASEQAEEVVQAINDLHAEPIYEGGQVARGISVRFLARMTLLRQAAGLLAHDDPLVAEAEGIIGPNH
jgi:hypothetical protein